MTLRRLRGPWAFTVVAAVSLTLAACGDDEPTAPGAPARYEVEVSGETFTVQVATAAQVAAFEARLASGVVGVIGGPLVAGNGGFNAPWSWHLDPAQTHTADAAIAVCDGRPSMVEADLGYWMGTVRQFCPWGAKVVRRLSS